MGKTVEVMIQHVENLRRMYTKEHAELLELRENLTPNERPFGSSERGKSLIIINKKSYNTSHFCVLSQGHTKPVGNVRPFLSVSRCRHRF